MYSLSCIKKHFALDDSRGFKTRCVHEESCDQCKYGFTNVFHAPKMFCIKHGTRDGKMWVDDTGDWCGTGCDDFEEGNFKDYYDIT